MIFIPPPYVPRKPNTQYTALNSAVHVVLSLLYRKMEKKRNSRNALSILEVGQEDQRFEASPGYTRSLKPA